MQKYEVERFLNNRNNRKFGLGVQNKAGGNANRVVPRERASHSKQPLPTTKDNSTHGHH